MSGIFFFFFFSSRRRHTSSYGDWSSDVCSSDLTGRPVLSICVRPMPGWQPRPRRLTGSCPALWSYCLQALPRAAAVWAGPSFLGRIAVLERQAGYISPAELRRAILTDLAGRPGATVRAAVLDALEPTGTGDTARATVDGSVHEYDVIVLAVGAWTHELLRTNGWRGRGYRTKSSWATAMGSPTRSAETPPASAVSTSFCPTRRQTSVSPCRRRSSPHPCRCTTSDLAAGFRRAALDVIGLGPPVDRGRAARLVSCRRCRWRTAS